MKKRKILLIFVHGWSVTDTDAYGELPERLKAEATAAGLDIEMKEIFLGRYISFHDEVRLPDISNAFKAAVSEQLTELLKDKTRFVCITHSTGGPVIRDWWYRNYQAKNTANVCPMSHLIMLAPANYGSALAQLGKARLSRMKSWFGGVEPGQGVLDWLALGSQEAWDLNFNWIKSSDLHISQKGVFPFVITGQSIDRRFYDNLNTYTGESGSDGVVRVAAANLAATYIRLEQQIPVIESTKKKTKSDSWIAPLLILKKSYTAADTALQIINNKSHSGKDMGIMRSVKKSQTDAKSRQTIESIIACLKVTTKIEYQKLVTQFKNESDIVQAAEKLEVVENLLIRDSIFIHDRYSMIIFRVFDHQGYPINDFDLILTAGENSDPNHLPFGFFVDKQSNQSNSNTITFYFNYDVMKGCKAVKDKMGNIIRHALSGTKKLGLKIIPRPDNGFVHYLPCEISATKELLTKSLQPNSTTMLDICLQRVVFKNVMRLDKGSKNNNFIKTKADGDIIN